MPIYELESSNVYMFTKGVDSASLQSSSLAGGGPQGEIIFSSIENLTRPMDSFSATATYDKKS